MTGDAHVTGAGTRRPGARKLKLGVLISGRGSNLQALIDACQAADFPAEIALVLSNRKEAQGLARAATAGLPTAVISQKDFASRDDFDAALDRALTRAGIDLVCLAGFMLLLQPAFVTRWQDRIINIHPSLLPAFRGLHVHERVLEAGVRISGCTVHYVRAEVDDGPIIVQAAVPVLPGDTPDSLAARVLEAEHRIYPQAVRLIASGQARPEGGKVWLAEPVPAQPSLINPPL